MNPIIVTGFRAERHCWKCFKENDLLTLIDDKPMNLCKGCLYTIKQMTQWLEAYGLKIRQIQYAMDLTPNDPSEGKNGVEEGVEGGETKAAVSKPPGKRFEPS